MNGCPIEDSRFVVPCGRMGCGPTIRGKTASLFPKGEMPHAGVTAGHSDEGNTARRRRPAANGQTACRTEEGKGVAAFAANGIFTPAPHSEAQPAEPRGRAGFPARAVFSRRFFQFIKNFRNFGREKGSYGTHVIKHNCKKL